MAKTKGLRLVRKLSPHVMRGLMKEKAKYVLITSDVLKKVAIIGDIIFARIVGAFPLATKWHKETRGKSLWCGISDQFSVKMIA